MPKGRTIRKLIKGGGGVGGRRAKYKKGKIKWKKFMHAN